MDLNFWKGKNRSCWAQEKFFRKAMCQLNCWKSEASDRILLSEAAYINQNKIHVVGRGSREAEKEVKQVSTLNFVCHMCGRLCKSNASLKSHLRAHGRGLGVTNDSPSNRCEGGDELWDGCRLLRQSNCHVYFRFCMCRVHVLFNLGLNLSIRFLSFIWSSQAFRH